MRTRTTTNLVALLSLTALAALGALPAACGGKTKTADDATSAFGTSSASADMPSTDSTSAASSAPTAASPDQPTALGGVFGTGPGASSGAGKDTKTFDALAAAPALKLEAKGVGAAKDALAKKMVGVAKTAAPGFAPEGPLGRASLKEGDRAQMDVTLQPGSCYAIVATSDKIKDLDLLLMVPPGEMSAQDTTDDESPVVGKAPAPFCPEAAASYKLGLYAEKGAGDAVVQVFSKKK